MNQLVIEDDAGEYRLTAAEFQQQAAMPAAVEWFANLGNSRTYPNDLKTSVALSDSGVSCVDPVRMHA